MEAIEPAFINSSSKPLIDIVELGSGTGKFGESLSRYIYSSSATSSPVFLHRPRKLLSTEPDSQSIAKMQTKYAYLQQATSHRLKLETLKARAENMPLPDSCARVVVCANSLHWFSNEKSMREIHRVLMPNGILVAIWSYPDITRLPWSLFYEKWMKPLYAQHGMPSIIRSDLKALIDRFENVFPLTVPVHLGEIIHPTILASMEDQLTFMRSTSPYNQTNEAGKQAMIKEMRAEIIRHEQYDSDSDSYRFPIVFPFVWAQCRKE